MGGTCLCHNLSLKGKCWKKRTKTLKKSFRRMQEILLDSGQVPQYLQEWLRWTTTWQTFEFKYLREWGARWAPAIERGNGGSGSWYLWVTSMYIHQNLAHIVSNLLLFVAMSVHLELNYGWWRLLLVWIISGVLRAVSPVFCAFLVLVMSLCVLLGTESVCLNPDSSLKQLRICSYRA